MFKRTTMMVDDYDIIPSFEASNQVSGSIALSFNMSQSEEYGTEVSQDSYATADIGAIVSVVVPIIFGLIVVIGLFGNVLVVIVVAGNPQMRSTTNLLIINLAVADLLFIVFCVPFTAWDYAFPGYWVFGDVWCRLVQYLIAACAFASIYTLVLMSFDRFLAVVHPIASISIRTQKNASNAIILTWISIMMLCAPAIFLHREHVIDYKGEQLSSCQFDEEFNSALYHLCFFMFSFVIPLTLIFILYVLMLQRLWFGNVPGGQMSNESVRSKKRVTRLVVVVVIVFAVCWCPIQVVLLLKSFDKYELTPLLLIIQITANVMAYMNSCVNPILYAFLSDNFRKAFRKVIVCWSSPVTNGHLGPMTDYRGAQSEIDRAAIEMSVHNTYTTKTTKVINENV